MSTTLNFKDVVDIPVWQPIANAITTNAAGMSCAYDLRNNTDRHPWVYYLTSNTTMSAYSTKNDEWMPLASPALTGTFGAGSTSVFHASQGPRGTLTTGNTTTSVVLSTALPAAVGVNQLANRGDGQGFPIKIVGNHAAGSGKTEIAYITGNTAGTTPTVQLDRTLTFTPASGDAYEILSGRVFLLGASTLAAGMWKYYDICTNSYSGNLATTNLPATVGTDSAACALSEVYVPYDRNPGEGFVVDATATYNNGGLKCLVATATTATTLTGQATSGDSAVVANQYRNFQIRIVEDTTTPTSVGQRRNITSHTAGASPVYTVATWTVTPSATAKFVIENNDDRILLRSSASASVFTYNITANTWDTTTFASGGTVSASGCSMVQAFGIEPDAGLNSKPGMIYVFRGSATTTLDVLDITGATTGSWAASVGYFPNTSNQVLSSGTGYAYDPVTNQGRYLYINQSGTQRNYRFDLKNRVMEQWAFLDYSQGTATLGNKCFMSYLIDGSTKLGFFYQIRGSDVYGWRVAISR